MENELVFKLASFDDSIVGEVNYSWIDTYSFYYMAYCKSSQGDNIVAQLIEYLKLITDLVKEGYLSDFRIGTSMFSLILSRSIKHHLRKGQKMIRIDMIDGNLYLRHNLYNETCSDRIKYEGVESIKTYLDKLKSFPFD